MDFVPSADRLEVVNCVNGTYSRELEKDILNGLTAPQKSIPSKYFYDTRGSILFEKICRLPEYYPTRTELSILKNAAPSIMEDFQEGDLTELGSGANWKIKTLLDQAFKSDPLDLRYVPVDVSESALVESSHDLLSAYPDLRVFAIVADFTRHIEQIPAEREKIFILFGSTIGNFSAPERVGFLRRVASLMGPGDRFILGLDMVKSKDRLERAYNDTQGVTSDFNKNVLSVVNKELNANFELDHFDHVAFFNEDKERIEMHLEANRLISVEIKDLGLPVEMGKGETIHTEISCKFTRESAEEMVSKAGMRISRWFTDSREWFSLAEMMVDG